MARPFAVLRFWLTRFWVVLPCMLVATAAAQQPTQSQIGAVKQNCRSDFQSYCSSVPTGGSAALQCLQRNLASLSPACGSAVSATTGGNSAAAPSQAPTATAQARPPMSMPQAMSPRQEAAVMRRSCGGDFRTYCQGVALGGGRALRCLAANEARLSPPCSRALAELRATR